METVQVIDSAYTRDVILAQNPQAIAPSDILDALQILEVNYVGYDGVLHGGQMVVHREVSDDVLDFFALAQELQFPILKVIPIGVSQYHWDDEVSCADNNSSGYNYRVIHGTNRLSKHARGQAFDINPAQNIYVKYDVEGNEIYRSPKDALYDEQATGTLTATHPLVLFMKERGWIWGGDWTKESGRVDYQHFEKDIEELGKRI
jgi:peptidoglycan LD-endopeptidase CwlK